MTNIFLTKTVSDLSVCNLNVQFLFAVFNLWAECRYSTVTDILESTNF